MDFIRWKTISLILIVSSVNSQIPMHASESLQVDTILKDSLIKLPVDELIKANVDPIITDKLNKEMSTNISKTLGTKIRPESVSVENANKSMIPHHKEMGIPEKDLVPINDLFNEGRVTELPTITEKSNIFERQDERKIPSINIKYPETANKELVDKDDDIIFKEEQNYKIIKDNLTDHDEKRKEKSDADVKEFVNSWKLGIPEDMVFTKAFVASLLVIIVSELGDKTFFIAAIMAMSNPRIIVFLGSSLALGSMHVMASLFGFVIAYIPRLYTFYASSALFIFFGLKMLWESWKMKPADTQEELEEVTSDLKKRAEQQQRKGSRSEAQDVAQENYENIQNNNIGRCDVSYQNLAFELNETSNDDAVVTIQDSETANDIETVKYFKGNTEDSNTAESSGIQELTLTHRSRDTETNTVTRRQVERRVNVGEDNADESSGSQAEGATKVLSLLRVMMTSTFFQAFSMTVLAEWGDRSQIATVIMGSTEDVWGIIVGGGIGHFLCTGLAVLGGQLIATKISVRTVTFIGGIVFLLFAVVGLVMGPD